MGSHARGQRGHHLPLPIALAAVLALSAMFASAPRAADAASSATIAPAVSSWLASAADDATLPTIVTFHDRAGLARLDAAGIGGSRLEAAPIAVAALTPSEILEVASWRETRSLWDDTANDFTLDESVALIGADRVAAGDGLRAPYTGAGIGVAVIDTGADSTHPDLASVSTYNVTGDPLSKDGVVVVPGPTVDTYGHGTHVTSTIAGSGAASAGRYAGVAPGAQVHSFKTDAGAVLLNSWALRVFDWILTHPEANIRVSSNSWGSGDGTDYEPDNPVNVVTKMLYDVGVTVVFAASNSGGPDTLNQYATSPWVVSVAASDKELNLADFSSRGRIDDNWDRAHAQSTNSGLYRPTVTAPGVAINAAKSAAATLMAPGVDPENPFYTLADGTSMATPHVAGAVALMLDARETLSPAHVITILEGTADSMPAYEIFEVGMGHLDAYESVRAAERGKVKFPPSTGGQAPEFTQTSAESFEGTVLLPNTWDLAQCPDATPTGLLNHHEFTVTEGTGAIYAEIDWANVTDLLYLRLYDPSCQVAGESAGLLDIGAVNHRALLVTNPVPGTWTVAVYGRINLPTAYTGSFETYVKN
jgi:serine protease AprX